MLHCTRCYFCWVRDCAETHAGELFCYKHKKYIIGDALEAAKEGPCAEFREDMEFKRMNYPVGVTPEEFAASRRAEIIEKLKGGKHFESTDT